MNKISIVIASFNNLDQFKLTIESIKPFKDIVEVIIVDSSDKECKSKIKETLIDIDFKYHWVAPQGVYPALNKGIDLASHDWVLVMGCGDLLLEGFNEAVNKVISITSYDMHVFGVVWKNGNKSHKFIPRNSQTFSHQGVIYKKSLHSFLGKYNEDFKVAADAVFINKVRSLKNFIIHDIIISYYDMSGISSKISISTCIEIFKVHHINGKNIFYSFYKGFITPLIKFIIGSRLSGMIRVILNKETSR